MNAHHALSRFDVLANDANVLKAIQQLDQKDRILYRDIHALMEIKVTDKTIERAIMRLAKAGLIDVGGRGKKCGHRYQVKP